MAEIKDKLVTAENLKSAYDELNNKSYEKLDVTYNKSNNTLVFQNSPELQKKVYVDKSLTKPGNAADAKVTGDAIAELKNENTELKSDIVELNDFVGINRIITVKKSETNTQVKTFDFNKYFPKGTYRLNVSTANQSDIIHISFMGKKGSSDWQSFVYASTRFNDVYFNITDDYDIYRVSFFTAENSTVCEAEFKIESVYDNSLGKANDNIALMLKRSKIDFELGNYFNKGTVTKGCYRYYKTDEIRSNGSYCYSDFIPVIPNETYYLNASNLHICFYDKNYSFVGGVTCDNSTIKAPSNCAFMIVSTSISSLDSIMVTHSNESPSEYTEYPSLMIGGEVIDKSKVHSKKVAFLGDSITQGVSLTDITDRYSSQFCSLTGCTEYNYGVSGTRVTKSDSYMAGKSFIERYSSIDSSCDIIVIFGGTNDYYGRVEIGEYGSTNDYDFYGAYNNLVSAIKTSYPNKPIVLITPMKSYYNNDTDWNNNYGTMEDYVTAIKKIGSKYSVPVLDLFHNSNIDGSHDINNRTYYFCNDDGIYLHPNKLGHERIANMLKQFMISNYIIF